MDPENRGEGGRASGDREAGKPGRMLTNSVAWISYSLYRGRFRARYSIIKYDILDTL